MRERQDNDLIDDLKANGWGAPAHLIIDVLEPMGPLGAQLLWVLQPALGVFFQRETLQQIATALEDPAALEALRHELEEDTPDEQ